MIELSGSVEIEYSVRSLWSLGLLTEGWTDEEKQALIDGDDEARDALITSHWSHTHREGGDVDEMFVDIRGLPGRKPAENPKEHSS